MRGQKAVVDDFIRTVRARRAQGIVTAQSVSTILRGFLQLYGADLAHSNRDNGPRRRGGQPGNQNRRVHGYYSRDWRRLEEGIAACQHLLGLPILRRTRLP